MTCTKCRLFGDIYRLLNSEKLSVYAIARELNRRGVKYADRSLWDYQAVYGVLTHPKYSGCHIFNRTSSQLCTPTIRLHRSQWILTPGAFEPIINQTVFDEAQKILQSRDNQQVRR